MRSSVNALPSRTYRFRFRVSGFGFRVLVFGFRVPGSGFRVSGLGFEFRVSDFRFRKSLGLRVLGIGDQGLTFGLRVGVWSSGLRVES